MFFILFCNKINLPDFVCIRNFSLKELYHYLPFPTKNAFIAKYLNNPFFEWCLPGYNYLDNVDASNDSLLVELFSYWILTVLLSLDWWFSRDLRKFERLHRFLSWKGVSIKTRNIDKLINVVAITCDSKTVNI